MKLNKKNYPLSDLEITAMAAEGKAIAKHDGMVIFIPFGAPGDVADIQILKQKKSFAEGKITRLIKASDKRIEPRCIHFGTCGGCKWQHVNYASQLAFKADQAMQDMQRIAKVEVEEYLPILGSEETYNYRNKLEFTFSNKAWEEYFDKENPGRIAALGFHKPGMFDKVLDISECHLAPNMANEIRIAVKEYAIEANLDFFDLRQQTGWLRNLMLRNTMNGEWMVVMIVSENRTEDIENLFNALIPKFEAVKSWCYAINSKQNDTWSDLPVITYSGSDYLTENFEGLKFKIRPQSFFQTNAKQAINLYRIAREFAGLTGTENVYDLYTGTGSIALFVAKYCKQIVGIEYVETAIKDAKENAIENNITNVTFYAGDMKHVLNNELIEKHGRPNVIITDPPRDGMHPDVVAKIIEMAPEKVVYVSCNTATQARDIAILGEFYKVTKIQTVDMFPHTHHVESVALLTKK